MSAKSGKSDLSQRSNLSHMSDTPRFLTYKKENTLNIMVIGETGVGKSSFIDLFMKHFEEKFYSMTESTVFSKNRILEPTPNLKQVSGLKEFRDKNGRQRSL